MGTKMAVTTYESVLDIRTHYKPTLTFQYTYYSSCQPAGVKKGFIKGEAFYLEPIPLKTKFKETIKHFQSHLTEGGYPESLVERTLVKVNYEDRKQALQPKISCLLLYQPAVPNTVQT